MSTDLQRLFKACWEREMRVRGEQSPSFSRDQYIATGRASAQYGGKRTEAWWLDEGPRMLERWQAWRARTGWVLWEPVEGKPAVELKINFVLPGDIPILAFIDRVFVTKGGVPVILDLKSGRTPETAEQLGLYACAIEAQYGLRIDWGYYWDANKGTHSEPKPLGMYTADYFGRVYDQAVAGIEAGSFLAKPQNACFNWCGVAHLCSANPANALSVQ